MGPELIFVAIAYYGSAVVGTGLLIAIIVKRSRRVGLAIFALAIGAAILGAVTVRPHWELVTAGVNFTVAGLGLGLMVALWKLSTWLLGKAPGRVTVHGKVVR